MPPKYALEEAPSSTLNLRNSSVDDAGLSGLDDGSHPGRAAPARGVGAAHITQGGSSRAAVLPTVEQLNTAAFLKLFYGNLSTGWLEITYLAPVGARVNKIVVSDPEGGLHYPGTVVDWHALPLGDIDPNTPRIRSMNERGYSVYFGVAIRRERKHSEWRTDEDGARYWCAFPRGTQADALYVPGLWADADAKAYGDDLDEARRRIEALRPSIMTFTGGGYQGYLLLDQPLEITDANRADVKRTLQGIANAVGSDKSVAELARIMRLPGTINTKPGRNGARCEVVRCD